MAWADPFHLDNKGDELRPLTMNGWGYVEGNPTNFIDPTGMCSRTGNTDCERFVSEVRCIIEGIRNGLEDCWWTWPLDEKQLVVDFLAHYYSFMELNDPIFNTLYIPGWMELGPTSRDKWPVPRWGSVDAHSWDHPINYRDNEEGKLYRQMYGFKRPFFEQSHHFFAFLKIAYHWGGPTAKLYNWHREREDQLWGSIKDWRRAINDPTTNPNDIPNYKKKYEWDYQEAMNDLYIVNHAADLAFDVGILGVDAIPAYLEKIWCAQNEADVWSLEDEVNQYYYYFGEPFRPENVERIIW